MRFISMIGSKEHPIIKKEISVKPIINNIKVELENDKLQLKIIGNNIKENLKYEWTINFDDKTITPSSTGSILVLSKSNTNEYIKSKEVTVFISVGKYISPIFKI